MTTPIPGLGGIGSVLQGQNGTWYDGGIGGASPNDGGISGGGSGGGPGGARGADKSMPAITSAIVNTASGGGGAGGGDGNNGSSGSSGYVNIIFFN